MKYIITTTIIACLALLSSCKKSDDATVPEVITPQEQITTVIIHGYDHNHPTDSSLFIHVKWEDLDGNGGNPPSIDSLLLDTGITYDFQLLLLDKTKNPYDTVSNEVLERGNMHQLFYTPSAALFGKLFIERLDKDLNTPALPIGLLTQWRTNLVPGDQLPLNGSLNIILSHYDGIPKTAVPSPESDIDITIPVRIR